MRKFIKDFGLYFGIFTGGLTVQDYLSKKKNLEEIGSKFKTKIEDLEKHVETKELEYQADMSQVKKGLSDMKTNVDNSIEKSKQTLDEYRQWGNSEAFKFLWEKTEECFNKVKDQEGALQNLIDNLKSNKNNFRMDDIFEQFTENFKNYLSTLNVEQTFALLHILFFFSMILLVYNIAIIFYSDLIIKYFSLETKYPKFARFIEIRRKFQRYYMTWNLIILLLILIMLLFLNFLVLLNLI
jgi:hypothetical protein